MSIECSNGSMRTEGFGLDRLSEGDRQEKGKRASDGKTTQILVGAAARAKRSCFRKEAR
jgi:hypothetical protein